MSLEILCFLQYKNSKMAATKLCPVYTCCACATEVRSMRTTFPILHLIASHLLCSFPNHREFYSSISFGNSNFYSISSNLCTWLIRKLISTCWQRQSSRILRNGRWPLCLLHNKKVVPPYSLFTFSRRLAEQHWEKSSGTK